jgi:flavin-dependent dehydrogenase
LIYSIQNTRLFKKHNKLEELGMKVLGVRTDSLYLHMTKENLELIEDNWKISSEMGNQKIEVDKKLWGKKMNIEYNELIDMVDYNNVDVIEYANEEEYKKDKKMMPFYHDYISKHD